MDSRRRLLLALCAGAAVWLIGWLLWQRDQPAALRRLVTKQVAAAYEQARATPLEAKLEPTGSLAEKALPLGVEDLWQWLSGALDSQLLELPVRKLSFATVDRNGARHYVDSWLFEPPAAAPDEVVIHLLSSGPKQPRTAFAEAVLFASTYDPPRRVLMLTLPVKEQRGEPWPALRTMPLEQFPGLLRQTALDVRRAVDVCRGRGWRVGGLGGYSLGACLAAAIAGLEHDVFAETGLLLWGAGGDLIPLSFRSDHWLVQVFQPRIGRSPRLHQRVCRICDPLTYVPLVKSKQIRLAAGRNDPVIPFEFAQRLAAAYREQGLSVTFVSDEGGHWRGPTLLQGLRSALPLPEGWQ